MYLLQRCRKLLEPPAESPTSINRVSYDKPTHSYGFAKWVWRNNIGNSSYFLALFPGPGTRLAISILKDWNDIQSNFEMKCFHYSIFSTGGRFCLVHKTMEVHTLSPFLLLLTCHHVCGGCTRSISPVLGTTVGDGRAVGRSCTFSKSKISTHNNSFTVFKFNNAFSVSKQYK